MNEYLFFMTDYDNINARFATFPGTGNVYMVMTVAASDSKYSTQSVTNYVKPSGGIPSTDLEQSIRNSLIKANSALQSAFENIDVEVTWNSANHRHEFTDNVFNQAAFQFGLGKQPIVTIYTKASGMIPSSPICSMPLLPYGVTDTEEATRYVGVMATSDTDFVYFEASSGGGGFVMEIDLTVYELASNKVTSLSAQSTDTQYPSAKCVYDLVGDVETLLAAI